MTDHIFKTQHWYVSWSDTIDAPTIASRERDTFQEALISFGYSRTWAQENTYLALLNGTNGTYQDCLTVKYLTVGETLVEAEGWWRVPIENLDQLIEHWANGKPIDPPESLLERYA